MKARILVGIASALISIFVACDKISPELPSAPEGCSYRTFGMGATKATVSVTWSSGDEICMYSLDENGAIIYKDTAEVTGISGGDGKVTALVADRAVRYFATYPCDAILCEVGDVLDDNAYKPVSGGTFSDVSYMTSYVETTDTDIWFQNSFSLLKLSQSSVYGTVEISSSLPSTTTVPKKNNSYYYIPISYIDESVTVKVTMQSGWRGSNVKSATFDSKVGTMYSPNLR